MHTSSKRASALFLCTIAGIAFLSAAPQAYAELHALGTPVLTSVPTGAAYTVYQNWAGFNFSGERSSVGSPGNLPAFNSRAAGTEGGITGTQLVFN